MPKQERKRKRKRKDGAGGHTPERSATRARIADSAPTTPNRPTTGSLWTTPPAQEPLHAAAKRLRNERRALLEQLIADTAPTPH